MTALSYLSIQHVTGHRKPKVPSPAERMRAYWATREPEFCNNTLSPSRVVRNPVEGGAVSSYEPDHVDPAYFTGHSYAELSRGF